MGQKLDNSERKQSSSQRAQSDGQAGNTNCQSKSIATLPKCILIIALLFKRTRTPVYSRIAVFILREGMNSHPIHYNLLLYSVPGSCLPPQWGRLNMGYTEQVIMLLPRIHTQTMVQNAWENNAVKVFRHSVSFRPSVHSNANKSVFTKWQTLISSYNQHHLRISKFSIIGCV